MSIERKIRLIQAGFGAIILPILMQPVFILGYSEYVWLVFLPLVLFFALGANFKKIPSMIVGYVCGVIWAEVNTAFVGVLGGFLPVELANLVATIIIIFTVLTVHENFLGKTVFGNVPAIFLGLATTFFTIFIKPANTNPIVGFHLIGFFLYGLLMSCVLVGGGFAICSKIFGKDKVIEVLSGEEKNNVEIK